MFLVYQNKALSREMQRYKRQIAESKKELELMRNKSREMESLVSIIQRTWSQVSKTFINSYFFHNVSL